jgi:serine/threonine protein kinase
MFPLPSRISRYEIKTLIGAGGMGSLYLARDTNPNTNRLVALKLLLANIDSGDLRERFAREARALAALNHPSIVDIYDSGEFQGSPYIVMAYVRGETLAEKIKRRAPMSLAQKLKLMVELCSGLGHAHEAGIIHRDIKPANLMVDQHGRLKILDFGIARVSEGLTRAGVQMTQLNMRIGTPGYMSPEQIEGLEIDRRSDIFAVGSVCYELLAYREAFTGTNTRRIENQVLQSQPERLTSLIQGLDPEIEAVVNRALEKSPDDRYQDAQSLEEAFERQRWRLGPAETPAPAGRPTPLPNAAQARRSSDSKADAAYQRALAIYDDGANDAARRFAIEALAEDPHHEDARAFLERLEPHRWRTAAPIAAPAETTAPTSLSTESHRLAEFTDAPTILSTSTDRTRGSAPTVADRSRRGARRFGRTAQVAAIVLGVVVVAGLAAFAAWRFWPSGLLLTITPPVGGTITSDGINCGTARADCAATIARNTTVELRAEPDAGFLFGGYTGDCVAGGRTTMSAARTCGATFNKIAEAPREVMHVLTVVKPEHGTVIGPGIRCGALGDECSAEHPVGMEITLRGLADENFRSAGFTGDCKKNGETVMNGPKRCAATFNPSRTASSGGATAADSISTPRVTPPSTRTPSSTPNTTDPIDRGTPGEAPARRDTDGDGKPDEAPRPTPEGIARDEIKKILAAYRQGYEKLDPDAIKRVYPGVSMNGLRNAFRDFKSLEYTYVGEPEFVDLNPALGTATVKAPATFAPVYKGPGSPPQNLINTFELARFDNAWTIKSVKVAQK